MCLQASDQELLGRKGVSRLDDSLPMRILRPFGQMKKELLILLYSL